jgi:large subunit ribosomal protein L24
MIMKSKKPSKQRIAIYQADLHTRHKLLSAHLSRELILKWKKRSMPVRMGDEVKVMRGEFTGTSGKISEVNMKRMKVYVDSVKRKKSSGEEVHVPVDASNLVILNPVMEDKKRMNVINRKGEKIGETKKTNNS